ncbi:MAG: helix-turn-helix domain-containing protein [Acidimicrobiales bacterium]
MTDLNTAPADAAPTIAPRLVYTVREAADELRIGYSTARERIATGDLRSFKDGSRRLIAGDDLLAYLRSRLEAPSDG